MNVAVVGSGYVGLVSGTCFAEMGANVWCVDVDVHKIENLKKGILPIYEDGLKDLVDKNAADGRLHFTTSLAGCIDQVEIVFIAVGTPPEEDGSADVSHVMEVAAEFGRHISGYTLLVMKSTVPVGTCFKVREVVMEELEKMRPGLFIQPYRGYIVNMESIKTIEPRRMLLKSGDTILIKRGDFRKIRDTYFSWSFSEKQ